MRSILFLFLLSIFVIGCGKLPQNLGQIIPDPENPGEVIVERPAPIEASMAGIIVPPMAPVKTYRGN